MPGESILCLHQSVELACRVVRDLLEIGQALFEAGGIRESSFQSPELGTSSPPRNPERDGANGPDFGGSEEKAEREPA